MEVKILSRETIKPSSPTPPHLRTFQLSLIDQLSPMFYTPLLFFYPKKKNDDDPNNVHPKNLLATLKTSLSKTLSRFFLLAGRIVDRSIHCSDKGAIFLEASVSCNMSEVLKEPNNEVLIKLLPCSVFCTEPIEKHAQIVVQANVFDCGGIAISLCLLHKLIDVTTLSCFLRSWASTNKDSLNSSPKMSCSDYKAFSSLFPQTNLLPFHTQVLHSRSDRKRRLRRFVFRGKAISDLKARAKSSNVPNPTSVEALTGFIWKHAMKASTIGTCSRSEKLSTLSHVVNLRKRMEPSLPEVSVGNVMWGAVAHYNSANESIEVKLSELVGLFRQSFAKINSDFVKGLMGDKGTRGVLKLIGEMNKFPSEVRDYYFFTSWRNMDLNEVDFGWGKPAWIGIAGDLEEIMTNIIVLLDTVSGDGVEAWMVLDEKEMKFLEQNPQFLKFALPNPSVAI